MRICTILALLAVLTILTPTARATDHIASSDAITAMAPDHDVGQLATISHLYARHEEDIGGNATTAMTTTTLRMMTTMLAQWPPGDVCTYEEGSDVTNAPMAQWPPGAIQQVHLYNFEFDTNRDTYAGARSAFDDGLDKDVGGEAAICRLIPAINNIE